MPTHRSLSEEEEQDLDSYLVMGLELVPLPEGVDEIDQRDGSLLVLGIGALVEALRTGAPPPDGLDGSELATCLGVLLGEELCRVAGWSWVQLSFEDGFEGLAAVDSNHGLAMLPIHYVYGLLGDPELDNSIGVLFQMICRKETPDVSPGDWRILG